MIAAPWHLSSQCTRSRDPDTPAPIFAGEFGLMATRVSARGACPGPIYRLVAPNARITGTP